MSPLIDVYPVGVLADLIFSWRAVRSGRRREGWRCVRWRWRCIADQVRQGRWREVRNNFNGFLAEHRNIGTRAGRGWTRRRALRDLHGHLAEVTRRG